MNKHEPHQEFIVAQLRSGRSYQWIADALAARGCATSKGQLFGWAQRRAAKLESRAGLVEILSTALPAVQPQSLAQVAAAPKPGRASRATGPAGSGESSGPARVARERSVPVPAPAAKIPSDTGGKSATIKSATSDITRFLDDLEAKIVEAPSGLGVLRTKR